MAIWDRLGLLFRVHRKWVPTSTDVESVVADGYYAYTGGNPYRTNPKPVVDNTTEDKVAESPDRKCAWVESAKEINLDIYSVLPTYVDARVTENGLLAVLWHEIRRMRVYAIGYDQLLLRVSSEKDSQQPSFNYPRFGMKNYWGGVTPKPSVTGSGKEWLATGDLVTKCGMIRRDTAGNARIELLSYLIQNRKIAIDAFSSEAESTMRHQGEISGETLQTAPNGTLTGISGARNFGNVSQPVWADCPTHD